MPIHLRLIGCLIGAPLSVIWVVLVAFYMVSQYRLNVISLGVMTIGITVALWVTMNLLTVGEVMQHDDSVRQCCITGMPGKYLAVHAHNL